MQENKPTRKPESYFSGMFMSQTQMSYDVPSSFVYDRKFDTALRKTQIQAVVYRFKSNNLTRDDKLIFKSSRYDILQEPVVKHDIVGKVYRLIRDQTAYRTIFEPHKTDHYRFLKDLIKDNVNIQLSYMMENFGLLNRPIIEQKKASYWTNMQFPPLIRNLMTMASWFSLVVETSNNIKDPKYYRLSDPDYIEELTKLNHMKCPYMDLEVVWSNRLVMFIVDSDQYILPKPALLMVQNKLCDMISVLMLATFGQGNNLPDDAYQQTCHFMNILADLSLQYQSKYYGIAKCLESLVIAETLIEIEAWDNHEFLLSITEDLLEDTGFQYIGSGLQYILQDAPSPFRHELSCLSKIMGHPLVDMEEGSKKLHKKTTEVYELSREAIDKSICYIKQNYVRNHIAKHKKWPPHEVIGHAAPAVLRHASLRNKDPESYEMSSYGKMKITDWKFVELKKNMVFNKMENAIPYLKDKTISVMRSKVFSKYIEQVQDRQDSWQDTRLLITYLVHPSAALDHTKYIDNYTYAPSLEEFHDYLVLRIVPKEKELKEVYRGFGCKTYEDRMRALVQEKNVMQYLDEYCDEQAMTLDELSLVKKIHSFRRLKLAYKDHHVIYVNIDASSWNNHFRKETVDDVMAETLDKIFDYPIFSKTMEAYQHTLFYVPDELGTYYWQGQDGGIEGLNQDTWVVTYLGQIKTAIEHIHQRIKIHVLCKGDDLRVAVIVPVADVAIEDLQQFKTSVVTSISKSAQQFGHEVKIQDSYGSQRYFSFSKEASIDSIELPQSYRKIQKCYGANNAFINSIDEYIASTYANAHSAAKTSPYPFACYLVALGWKYFYLLSDDKYSVLPQQALVALGLIPNMLGGFPIIYLHNIFVRCESDLLSPFLGILIHTKINYPETYIYLSKFCYVIPHNTNYEKIYADPYAVSVDIPTKPAQKLKQTVIPLLRRIVKNESIRDLMAAADSEEDKMCVEILDSANIIAAKTFSIIYAALPRSVIREIVNKFEAARSIAQLMTKCYSRRKTTRMLRQIVNAEKKLQEWRIKILNTDSRGFEYSSFEHLQSNCPAEYADRVRFFSWGKRIEEVTMPPMQHLMLYTTQAQSQTDEWCRLNHFQYQIIRNLTKLPGINYDWHHFETGEVKPFVGSSTTTSTDSPQIHFVEKDILLSKVSNLINLKSWTHTTSDAEGIRVTSNLSLLIDKIMSIYTNLDPKTLAPFGGRRIRGTRQHHLRGVGFRDTIVPNMLTNVFQQIIGKATSHIRFSESSDNFLMNFLHILCYSVSIACLELAFSKTRTTPVEFWGVTRNCSYCSLPISETPVVIKEGLLKHIVFNPLDATIISETSERIIKETLIANEQHKYREEINIGLLSLESASIGVLSEYLRMSIRHAQVIKSRYTDHANTGAGIDVLSAFLLKPRQVKILPKDLKRIPLEILTNITSQIIFDLFLSNTKYMSTSNMSYIMNALPATELPWYSLCIILVETGLINDIVIRISAELNLPIYTNFHTPEQTATLLGSIAIEYVLQHFQEYPLIILTNLDQTDIIKSVSSYLRTYSWLILHSQFIYWKSDNHESNIKLAFQALLFLLSEFWNEDFIEITALEDYTHNEITIPELSTICSVEELSDLYQNLKDETLELEDKLPVLISYVCHKLHVKIEDVVRFEVSDDELADHCGQIVDMLSSRTVKITIATLVDCINVLALQEREDVDESQRRPNFIHVNPVLIPTIKYHKTRLLTIPLHIEYDNPCNDYNNIIPEYTFNKSKIGDTYCYRPVGYYNVSSSVMLELYREVFSIYPMTHKNFQISCLGDGLGSITAFLAGAHPGSRVLYNTLQESHSPNTRPDIALSKVQYSRCELVYSHIDEGCYDLTLPETLKYYETLMPKNNIVTCDAEIILDNAEELFTLLWNNVVVYFLNTRLSNSILILRLDTRFMTLIMIQITKLMKYGCQVYLYYPKCHATMISIYLIAVNQQHASVQLPYAFDQKPLIASHTINMMKNWVRRCHQFDEKGKVQYNRFIDISPKYNHIGSWNLIVDPLYVSYYQMHLHIALPYDNPDGEWSCDTLEQYISMIDFKYDPIIQQILTYLRGETHHIMMRDRTYDLNTLAHRRALIRWWFRLHGFKYIVDIFTDDQVSNIVQEHVLREYFLRLLRTLPNRDIWMLPVTGAIYRPGYKDAHGLIFPIYSEFMLGFKIGVSMIAGCAIRFTRRVNDIKIYDPIIETEGLHEE